MKQRNLRSNPNRAGTSLISLVGGLIVIVGLAALGLNAIGIGLGSGEGQGGDAATSPDPATLMNSESGAPIIRLESSNVKFGGADITIEELGIALDDVEDGATVRIFYDRKTPNDLVNRVLKLCEDRSLPAIDAFEE